MFSKLFRLWWRNATIQKGLLRFRNFRVSSTYQLRTFHQQVQATTDRTSRMLSKKQMVGTVTAMRDVPFCDHRSLLFGPLYGSSGANLVKTAIRCSLTLMTTSQHLELDLEADSAEFCRSEGLQDRLAVGTYHLDEKSRERSGRLYTYTLNENGRLRQKQALDTAAIFDMRWLAQPGALPSLAMATAAGTLEIASMSTDGLLEITAHHTVFDGAMTASISSEEGGHRLGLSSSGGELAIAQLAPAGLHGIEKWEAHDLEAWTCCFDQWQTLYSGGDDCAFKGWDLRQSEANCIFANRKAHTAGICCITSNPHEQHTLLTGSYDERIRHWDTRQTRKPLKEVEVGGGVWRLKWHPHRTDMLLAACMHAGFKVLKDSGGVWQVLHHYAHQRTLGYGADWCHDPQMPYIATASFYDRLLHIWKLPVEAQP